ncbi:Peptidyl-prolyl cis-trans isomerase CYP21-4, partial [Mucuna pruriens]
NIGKLWSESCTYFSPIIVESKHPHTRRCSFGKPNIVSFTSLSLRSTTCLILCFRHILSQIRLNGEDQTSGSATAKQKEEGSFSLKYHDYYILCFDCCLGWVFRVCFVQTLVQQVKLAIGKSLGENTFVDSKKSELPGYAVLNTSKGSIIIELYKESAPEVVDEFIDLWALQGDVFSARDNHGTGAAEDWNLRGKQHTISSMKHEAFMLGTSKGKHNNKGFDLFITTAPIPDLNEKLIVFGKVIKGEDVVQEIEEVDTDEHYKPKISIGILDVTLKQKV